MLDVPSTLQDGSDVPANLMVKVRLFVGVFLLSNEVLLKNTTNSVSLHLASNSVKINKEKILFG